LGGRGRQISEFEASLVYKVSSRTARATEKPCLQKPKTKTKKKKKKGKVNLRTATGRSCRNDVRSYLSEEMTDNSMSTVALRIFQKDRMNREVCVCWGDRTQ
jgi:endonuclease YncB( thermonuclease family)